MALAAENIKLEHLAQVDPWYWALHNKIQLVGGEFDFKLLEFQVEVLQDQAHRKQCARKATQAAFTEAHVLKVLHGMIYGKYRRGALYLFPTRDEVSDFSTSRFAPLIKQNPGAIGRFVRETDQANLKKIGGAFLYFRSGRMAHMIQNEHKSSSKLKSIPADVVVFDELDEMDQDAVPLALARMEASDVKESFYLGNPTIPDYGIDALYQTSDQRCWMVRCEKCNTWTCFDIEFPECLWRKKDGSVVRVCKKCGREVETRRGEWVAQYPDRADTMVGRWIGRPSMPRSDLKELLGMWESPNLNTQQFYNLHLGLPYADVENRIPQSAVFECCTADAMSEAHAGPCIMGVDVGKPLWAVVGQKVSDKTLKVLRAQPVEDFKELHVLAAKFHVECAVIDLKPEMHMVRDFGFQEPYEVWGCDYKENITKEPSWNEIDRIVSCNRNEICDATHGLVMGYTGQLELPRKTKEVERFASHMASLVKRVEEDPRTGVPKARYVRVGDGQDHYRHALNYFLLASRRVNPQGRGGAYRKRREIKITNAGGWT